jgi:signal transduction histidine kinase
MSKKIFSICSGVLMNVQERINGLKKTDLFEQFTEDELLGFAENVTEEHLAPGEVLFYEGAPAYDMYIILEGSLRVFKESRSITTIKAVDYIGEMAIIETKPRSATVEAIEPSLLLRITQEQFQKYFSRQPVSLVSMMRTLSQRIRRDTELIAEEFEKANMMIHDMKNLLTIFLFLEPMKKMLSDERMQGYIKYMQTGREDLMAMMKEALANAKSLYRPMPLVKDSLTDLVHEMAKSEFQAHPELSDREIIIKVDDHLPEFPFCRLEMKRVFTNLVLNAVQASEPGTPITIELSKTGDDALVQVTDQGSGIPEQYQDKIFNAHFTTKENGNGLGLSSCQRIVERRHKGKLSFVSKPGEGTMFRFTMPLSSS